MIDPLDRLTGARGMPPSAPGWFFVTPLFSGTYQPRVEPVRQSVVGIPSNMGSSRYNIVSRLDFRVPQVSFARNRYGTPVSIIGSGVEASGNGPMPHQIEDAVRQERDGQCRHASNGRETQLPRESGRMRA
jgi:hypothetical protein